MRMHLIFVDKEGEAVLNWIRKKNSYSKGKVTINQQEQVVYLTFPNLERTGLVKHGFSTRLGGVSEGMFSSMNLSFDRGDNEEHVRENFRRMAKVLGSKTENMVFTHQTHTSNIRVVTAGDKGKGIHKERDYKDIDGLITNEPGIMLVTFYADCVPVYLVDVKNRAIGLCHSGWRGTVGKISIETLKVMKEQFGTCPTDVVAAIGPSICQDCYEVSEDVILEFAKVMNPLQLNEIAFDKGNGKFQLDLWKANALWLEEAGVLKENIQVTDICTCCNGEVMYSHRASKGKRGSLAAFMELKG